MDLTHATCLVTGANRGIGLAVCRELATRRGTRILAGVRELDREVDVAPRPGGAAEVRKVRMDLSSRESIDACCDGLGDQLGSIDLLVNNAGLMTGGLLEEQEIDRIYAMFQTNLVAVAHLSARVLPGMVARDHGTILNNASISAIAHFPAASTYAASKTGVHALTESLRRELQPTGVNAITAITPGVRTDMLDDTEEVYGRHLDTSGWESVPAGEWAARLVQAVESGSREVKPGGKALLAVLAARGPAQLVDLVAKRSFSRRPRG